MRTIQYADHTAHLDPMTGCGVLICPRARDDLSLFGLPSLQASSWDAVMRDLYRLGWEPLPDENDLPLGVGRTAEGCEVVGLSSSESVISEPSLLEIAEAMRALESLAGVVRT